MKKVTRKIFQTKDDVKDVEVGEMVGVGYPNIHNVYRVTNEGNLNFIYHFIKSKEGDSYEKDHCNFCNRNGTLC